MESDSNNRTEKTGCSRHLGAIALAALCAIATLAVYVFFATGPRLPEIDQAKLDEAAARWEVNAPESYNVTVAVTGPRAAQYYVEVRDGKATKALRDGSPLTDARTMGTWSVPGMFDTIQADVEHATEPIQISAKESHYVSTRAKFE